MITIQTRQNKHGNWWCNCTCGYDHSFEAPTIEEARSQMKDLLDKKGVPDSERKWVEPKPYTSWCSYASATPDMITSKTWRIDK